MENKKLDNNVYVNLEERATGTRGEHYMSLCIADKESYSEKLKDIDGVVLSVFLISVRDNYVYFMGDFVKPGYAIYVLQNGKFVPASFEYGYADFDCNYSPCMKVEREKSYTLALIKTKEDEAKSFDGYMIPGGRPFKTLKGAMLPPTITILLIIGIAGIYMYLNP